MTEEQLQSTHCDKSRGTSKGARILRNIGEVSKYYPINEPILCIGCGDGLEIEAWKLLGYNDVRGIEIDREKAKIAKKHGCNVSTHNIEDWFINEDLFIDVIKPGERLNVYCAHTLEHCSSVEIVIGTIKDLTLNTACIIVPIEPNGTKNPSHHSPVKKLSDINLDMPIVLCAERYNDELEGIKVWSFL